MPAARPERGGGRKPSSGWPEPHCPAPRKLPGWGQLWVAPYWRCASPFASLSLSFPTCLLLPLVLREQNGGGRGGPLWRAWLPLADMAARWGAGSMKDSPWLPFKGKEEHLVSLKHHQRTAPRAFRGSGFRSGRVAAWGIRRTAGDRRTQAQIPAPSSRWVPGLVSWPLSLGARPWE